MDYHAIHGHDIASFDTSGTHRLPTVSASQALDELQESLSAYISTGLQDLDRVLLNLSPSESSDEKRPGGVKRGQVTEIWGPPGTGKTALGIQITANALCSGDAVVWVDCCHAVRNHRVSDVVQAARAELGHSAGEDDEDDSSRFIHYECLTLPHFVALVSRPTTQSIPANASLVVVSNLSALVNSALPKAHDGKGSLKPTKGPSPSAKRLQALQAIMAALQRLAATRNCAVVVLSQCATKMHGERGATLTPAVNAAVWEQGIATRLVLFRNWVWQGNKLCGVLLAGLQKLDGRTTPDAVESVVAFKVQREGISKVAYDIAQTSIELSGLPHHAKRKLGQTELEVPDSEADDDDEDYGWAEEDESAMPPPPPQWQGSEDLILGQEVGRSEDEESEPDPDPDDDGDEDANNGE